MAYKEKRIPVKDVPGLFKVGDTYFCDFYRAEFGRHRKALGTDARAARNYVKLKLASLSNSFDDLAGHITWLDYTERYKAKCATQNICTRRFVNKAIEDVQRIISPRLLADVNENSLSKVVVALDADQRGKYSINRERRAIIKMIREAERLKLVPKHDWTIVPKFKEAKGRLEYYTPEQLKLISANATGYLHKAVMLALYAGFRVGEVWQAQFTDIDWEKGIIWVQKKPGFIPKDYECRFIPLQKPLLKYLKALPRKSESDYIVSLDAFRPKTPEVVSTQFRDMCNRLKFPYTKFHLLRHNFGTFLADNDVNPFVIQKVMGHSRLDTVMIYVHEVAGKAEKEFALKISKPMF